MSQATRPRLSALWRNPDFLRLWAAQTTSVFGDQVTALALPLLAIISLHAGPQELGLLRAAGRAPFLLLGLFVGVWVDRRRRRPILIGADLGRALLIGSIVVMGLLGRLTVGYLALVAFLVGLLTVCFDVAEQSFVPALVGREQLVEANSKLVVTGSAAQIAGPGLAGALVQLFTAPLSSLG